MPMLRSRLIPLIIANAGNLTFITKTWKGVSWPLSRSYSRLGLSRCHLSATLERVWTTETRCFSSRSSTRSIRPPTEDWMPAPFLQLFTCGCHRQADRKRVVTNSTSAINIIVMLVSCTRGYATASVMRESA